MNWNTYSFLRERHQVSSVSYECDGCGIMIRMGVRFWLLIGKKKTGGFGQLRFCSLCEDNHRPKIIQQELL